MIRPLKKYPTRDPCFLKGPRRRNERDRGGGQAEPSEGGEGYETIFQADRPVSQERMDKQNIDQKAF
jgi:hypothetical protein